MLRISMRWIRWGGIAGDAHLGDAGELSSSGLNTQLHYQPSRTQQRTRIYTILGCTLANWMMKRSLCWTT